MFLTAHDAWLCCHIPFHQSLRYAASAINHWFLHLTSPTDDSCTLYNTPRAAGGKGNFVPVYAMQGGVVAQFH
jgi:hypothetical protein